MTPSSGAFVIDLSPSNLLSAYAQGAFPMTDRDGQTRWYTANPRGVIPLEAFHIPHTLRAVVRRGTFQVTINRDFEGVIRACMSARREGSWISEALVRAYGRLHDCGNAHSVEAWRDGELAGGLYGVSLGGAFFGESMFHYKRDASKVALVHLVERLKERGYLLLDTQANTPHLRRFGCIDVSAEDYMHLLDAALKRTCAFV